jgi:hypothetical protein
MPIIALMDRTAGLIQYLGKAADAEAALQELRSGIDSDFPNATLDDFHVFTLSRKQADTVARWIKDGSPSSRVPACLKS